MRRPFFAIYIVSQSPKEQLLEIVRMGLGQVPSSNYLKFIDLFDGVFVLEVDLETSLRRIEERVALDPTNWGGRPEEVEISKSMYQTKDGVPETGMIIDAAASIDHVVDEIIRLSDG